MNARLLSTARRLAALARHDTLAASGYLVLLLIILLSLIAPLIAPYNPRNADFSAILQAPSSRHLFGTDSSGMDIFSRMLFAPRIDLAISFAGIALSFIVGTTLGIVSGYYEGRGLLGIASEGVLRIADVVQSFPVFVLAMALVVFAGQQTSNIIIAIAFVTAPLFIRLARGATLAVRRAAYVEAARVAGLRTDYILRRHVLPNAVTPPLIQISGSVGWAILLTAGLSFIGAGVRIPTPELGIMVAEGAPNIISGQWWPSLFPGLMIIVVVTSVAVIGRHVQAVLDPRQRAESSLLRSRASLASAAATPMALASTIGDEA